MHDHTRQFVIGPKPVTACSDWKSETVRGVGFLSHCPKLPVCKVAAQDGSESILIGIAVQTDPSRPSPIEELKNPPANVAELTHNWAGRFARIANGFLLTDTAAPYQA
jgi:hypothetical protein